MLYACEGVIPASVLDPSNDHLRRRLRLSNDMCDSKVKHGAVHAFPGIYLTT